MIALGLGVHSVAAPAEPSSDLAVGIDRLMRIVPPPPQLLVGENFLVGAIGVARLRQPVALRSETCKSGPVRIEAAPVVVPSL